jgi:glycerol-3-phosphate O-acyltransferase
MNHRSNMDYVLVSFLAAERVALSYAVGEWARIWPLQSLIRAMGAYFVRRNSGDPLYRMVLQRYVQMATEGGVPQAMYPEGGLTTDGRLRVPKLGLLDYMLKGFDPEGERDLVFVPVGLNYDRVLEDRTLLRKLDAAAGRVSTARSATTALRFLGRQAWHALRGRRFRHGYACVNFGRPISMRAWSRAGSVDFRRLSDADRRCAIAAVGRDLMAAIGRIVPVLPVPLVATVLLRDPARALSALELKSAVQALMDAVEARGGRVYVPRADRDYAIEVGLRMLTLRRLVIEEEGLFHVAPGELPILRYYANSIAHLFDAASAPAPPTSAVAGGAGVASASA